MIYVPPWLELARQEARMGVSEIPGELHNAHIVTYGTAVGLYVTADEVPWCSNFVNWIFMQLDEKRTNSARARSWLEWGISLRLPALGCVTILSRGGGEQPGPDVIEAPGHVGFLVDQVEPGTVTILGGNQSNRVCEKTYPADRVLGYRWPR